MLILIMTLATFFNIVIIRIKYNKQRYQDIFFDVGILFTLGTFSGGTLTGLAVATSVSFLISLWLYFSPPNLLGAN